MSISAVDAALCDDVIVDCPVDVDLGIGLPDMSSCGRCIDLFVDGVIGFGRLSMYISAELCMASMGTWLSLNGFRSQISVSRGVRSSPLRFFFNSSEYVTLSTLSSVSSSIKLQNT